MEATPRTAGAVGEEMLPVGMSPPAPSDARRRPWRKPAVWTLSSHSAGMCGCAMGSKLGLNWPGCETALLMPIFPVCR